MPARGVLQGQQLQPREIASICYAAGWRDKNLIIAVAVCLAESQGYIRAYNDNLAADGETILSRDVGIFQINIPANKVGTPEEERLYNPHYNVSRARTLFESRGFQPWVAYNTGIALNPAWWRWSEKQSAWVGTGRYVHRATRGCANFYALEMKIASPDDVMLDYRAIPSKPQKPPGSI